MKKVLLVLLIFTSIIVYFSLFSTDSNLKIVLPTENNFGITEGVNNNLQSAEPAENNAFVKDISFNTILSLLQENYDALTTETCGEAYNSFEDKLIENNIKFRQVYLFADPYQNYETHVVAEVFVNNEWILLDPTFDGYYLSVETKKPLCGYDIRTAVKENQLDKIQWVQNGKAKKKYDITKYYINPLYLFKGLMYESGGKSYYITDDWMKPFNLDNTIFIGRDQIIPIMNPDEIGSVPLYGVDRGYVDMLIKNWEQYKTIETSEEHNWVNMKTDSGGIVATVKVEKGKCYAFEVPVNVNEGTLTISVQSGKTNIYDAITEDIHYKSKVFIADSKELKIYLYSDSPIDFSYDKTQIKLDKISNDFDSKIKIISVP